MILRRVLRVALRLSLLRAWSQREVRWLWVAGGVVLVRLLQRRGQRSRPAPSPKPS